MSAAIVAFAGCQTDNTPEVRTATPLPFTMVAVQPDDGGLPALLQAEVAKAEALGQKPYVEVTATWCPPCQAIKKSLHGGQSSDGELHAPSVEMLAAFKGAYIIQLDADAWKGKMESTGISGAAIPIFYELDKQGEITGRQIDGGAWGENIPENMAPPLNAFFHPE